MRLTWQPLEARGTKKLEVLAYLRQIAAGGAVAPVRQAPKTRFFNSPLEIMFVNSVRPPIGSPAMKMSGNRNPLLSRRTAI
jgi:hypothetical protein